MSIAVPLKPRAPLRLLELWVQVDHMSYKKPALPNCPQCGRPIRKWDRFCSQCGSRLATHGNDAFLPVVRRERKIVSVMFADVKGSTEVISASDPERASEWLGRIIDLMRSAVHNLGGTVNRVQGDGIMALFGAPIECEDHSVRACAAAIEMIESVQKELIRSDQADIRIGIASGEVMTLPVMSDPAINYDAMGSVVHLAARLEQAATPGFPLISFETWRSANQSFETRRRELKGLRGLPATVPAFDIVGWKARRDISVNRSEQMPKLFVGRANEIAILSDALAHLRPKSGRSALVIGEAGVGKSRLISEFLANNDAEVHSCVCRASPYRSFPYGPLAELVAELVGVDDEDDLAARKLQLARIIPKVRTKAIDLAALGTLLDPTETSSELASLSPVDRRLRVEAASIALFTALSNQKPLVLVCEDIHWLQEDGLRQLWRILDGVRSARCLVILTARDSWDGTKELQIDYRCELRPLEPASARLLLDALIRPGLGTAALGREILDRTRGNPLFIEESLNVLHQTAALARDGDAYILMRPGVDVPLSPTVRGLLAARIDRLEDLQKDFLQAISVIGDGATIALLQSLFDIDRSVLQQVLARLIVLGFLEGSTAGQQSDSPHFAFRHPLVKEVTYEQMLVRDRVRIHGWMLKRLEDERAGLRDRLNILAEHAFRAQAWEKAAVYMLRAGNAAFWRDEKTEAERYLARGLEASEKTDAGRARDIMTLKLHLELRNPLFQLARIEDLGNHLDAARPLALQYLDATQSGRYHIFQSHYHWFTGRSSDALMESESAERLASANGIKSLSLRARFQCGLVYFSRGAHRDAIDAMNDVTAGIVGHDKENAFGLNRSLLVTTLAYSARAYADLGELTKARRDAARSLAVARELNNQFELVFAYIAEGWVNLCANDPERAVPFLEKAYEICSTEDVPLWNPVATSFLSAALLDAAELTQAVRMTDRSRVLGLADEAVRRGEEFKFGAFQPWRVANLSRALLADGRTQKARGCAIEARDMARRQLEPLAEIESLIVLALAHHSLGMDWKGVLFEAAGIAESREFLTALTRCRKCETVLSSLS